MLEKTIQKEKRKQRKTWVGYKSKMTPTKVEKIKKLQKREKEKKYER